MGRTMFGGMPPMMPPMPPICAPDGHGGWIFVFQSDLNEENTYSPSFVKGKDNFKQSIIDEIGGVTDAYTKAETDALLVGKADKTDTDAVADNVNKIIAVFGGNIANLQASLTNWVNYWSFIEGVNTVNTLSAVPTTKRSILASVSTNQTLSITDTSMPVGECLNIQVHNTGAATITIALPGLSMSGTSADVEAGKYAEINVWKTGTGSYVYKVMYQE